VAATAIALIGALAGAELPLLMAWAGERGRFKVLALDYLGMVLACLAFPLLFLPELGLFGTLLLTAALNAVIALILSPSRPLPGRPALVAWVVVLVFLLQKEEAIRQCLSQIFVHAAL
jgi:spermidine synthase